MAKTPEQFLREIIADLIMRNAILMSENEGLKEVLSSTGKEKEPGDVDGK